MPVPSADAILAVDRNAVPAAYSARPEVGEIVPPSDWDLRARIQGYAFLAGFTFVVVQYDSRPGRAERLQFRCVYWGDASRNTRGLVEEDRQRDRTVAKLACPVSITVSYIRERGVK
jgi:hypothetical protein